MAASSQASLLLQKQLKDLCKNPVAGFSAGLVDETNIYEWSVTIIGPPDTLYEGGFFNAIMSFPSNYPNSPPTVKFTTEIWHPNVYPDGRVCISILHPPGDDPNGYELASERWMPVHTVESIVLSIISMLSSPNDESPANVEAACFRWYLVLSSAKADDAVRGVFFMELQKKLAILKTFDEAILSSLFSDP
ncbi:ubiquitin-conjugating enzyme E2 7-like isoform X2 [Mangifera indica]|uniref:ubiquitin-conjugating enzyme E2 7-like isoform X2 n=1 Tax=Mangifera indica TaxID=29780 RepID=UPI001CFB205D|nr:ubiquitin-conjugating enzyme E2 7-like isoform X2 [Mangifera indica]